MSLWWKSELRFSCLMLWRKIDFCSHVTRCCGPFASVITFSCGTLHQKTLYSRMNAATSVEYALNAEWLWGSFIELHRVESRKSRTAIESGSQQKIYIYAQLKVEGVMKYIFFFCCVRALDISLVGSHIEEKLQRQRNAKESQWIAASHMKQTSTFDEV